MRPGLLVRRGTAPALWLTLLLYLAKSPSRSLTMRRTSCSRGSGCERSEVPEAVAPAIMLDVGIGPGGIGRTRCAPVGCG